MMRRILLLLATLVLLAPAASSQVQIGLGAFLSADCTAETTGFEGQICAQAAGQMFVCTPSGGGVCDTPGEWVQTAGGTSNPNGVNQETAIFTIENSATGTALDGTTTSVRFNGTLTEVWDPSGDWTVDGSTLEVCYTGSGGNRWIMQALVRINAAGAAAGADVTVSVGHGTTPVADADIWGHNGSRAERTTDSNSIMYGFAETSTTFEVISGAPDTLDTNECFAILGESTIAHTWAVTDAVISIETGPTVAQSLLDDDFPVGFPGYTLRGTQSAASTSTVLMQASPNGSLWIRGSAGNIDTDLTTGGAHAINRVLIGRPGNRANSPFNGFVWGNLDVMQKGGGSAIDLWPNEDTATATIELLNARFWGQNYLDGTITNNGNALYDAPLRIAIADDLKAQLEAIGYNALGQGPVAGVRSDWTGFNAGPGWVVGSTEPATGGGVGVAASGSTLSADFDALVADASWIANDGSDTSQFATGQLYLDDGDGTPETGEPPLGTGSASDNHGVLRWGVSNGTTFDTGDEVCGAVRLTCVTGKVFDLGGAADFATFQAPIACTTAVTSGDEFFVLCK